MKNKLSEIANSSKNLLLGLLFNPWLCVFSPRTSFKPRLTVRNPINSPVFAPALLQIYCIGLIEPISYSFWVWAAIYDHSIIILTIISKNEVSNYFLSFLPPKKRKKKNFILLCTLKLTAIIIKTNSAQTSLQGNVFLDGPN